MVHLNLGFSTSLKIKNEIKICEELFTSFYFSPA